MDAESIEFSAERLGSAAKAGLPFAIARSLERLADEIADKLRTGKEATEANRQDAAALVKLALAIYFPSTGQLLDRFMIVDRATNEAVRRLASRGLPTDLLDLYRYLMPDDYVPLTKSWRPDLDISALLKRYSGAE